MEDKLIEIKHNLDHIKNRIHDAAASAGRQSEDIRLVVVIKSRSFDEVQAAVSAGAKILGENYPEDSLSKIQMLGDAESIEWHMIGHLQKRKIPIVAEHFNMMHSIDRYSIAEKLNEKLVQLNRRLPVLLEMNVGGEETKYGWLAMDETKWDVLLPEIEMVLKLSNLEICGLMTMPPLTLAPNESKGYFIKLRKLQDYLNKKLPQARWYELSMGTSSDYESAIKEGATYIRIGHAIFSPGLPLC